MWFVTRDGKKARVPCHGALPLQLSDPPSPSRRLALTAGKRCGKPARCLPFESSGRDLKRLRQSGPRVKHGQEYAHPRAVRRRERADPGGKRTSSLSAQFQRDSSHTSFCIFFYLLTSRE